MCDFEDWKKEAREAHTSLCGDDCRQCSMCLKTECRDFAHICLECGDCSSCCDCSEQNRFYPKTGQFLLIIRKSTHLLIGDLAAVMGWNPLRVILLENDRCRLSEEEELSLYRALLMSKEEIRVYEDLRSGIHFSRSQFVNDSILELVERFRPKKKGYIRS